MIPLTEAVLERLKESVKSPGGEFDCARCGKPKPNIYHCRRFKKPRRIKGIVKTSSCRLIQPRIWDGQIHCHGCYLEALHESRPRHK